MTERDIAQRLRDACVGHPYAQIPWPHRVLHEGADEIERLRDEVERLRGEWDALNEATDALRRYVKVRAAMEALQEDAS